MSWENEALEFIKISHQFKLGHLITESPHPRTTNLSSLAQENLKEGYDLLQSIDLEALRLMSHHDLAIFENSKIILDCLKNGNKVFLSGCGATGRLSLVIETLARQMSHFPNQIISFMAGGDYALIKSVESFEDKVEYGQKQLMELGFCDGDILIAITEGGETPFVIATALQAAKVSSQPVFFVYCNPDESLRLIERSNEVLNHPQIIKLNLTVGPMALTGSTRMQASTVQLMLVGLMVLFDWKNKQEVHEKIVKWISIISSLSYHHLVDLTEWETQETEQGRIINYLSHPQLAITVLTDTTERSPTFSQLPFENHHHPEQSPSLSYLFIPSENKAKSAWESLLQRPPRTLKWQELKVKIDDEELMGFDLSLEGLKKRKNSNLCSDLVISRSETHLMMEFNGKKISFDLLRDHHLLDHLILKMLLNAHSTLLMGRKGFYQSNIMTWVKASNNKLIDRASRYVQYLGRIESLNWDYEEVVRAIIKMKSLGEQKGPIVLRAFEYLKSKTS